MDFNQPVQAIIPGAQGRILAVLAHTTAELSLRTIARLSDVSPAQTSRVLPQLVRLGLVTRREVPPSTLFALELTHVAAEPLLRLARSRELVLERMGELAAELPVRPVSVIVFGSFARGDGEPESDIDVVLVRPAEADPESESWLAAIDQWTTKLRCLTGNSVEILEVGGDEVGEHLAGDRPVWRDIRRQGIVVFGRSFALLSEHVDAR
jgi:predicted nucleotidyltransferase